MENTKKTYTALGYEKKSGALSDNVLSEKMVGVFNAALHNHGIKTSFTHMGATSHTENGIVASFGGDIRYEIFFDDKRYKACIHESICGDVVARFGGTVFHNPYQGRGYIHGYKYHAKWKQQHEISVARVDNETTLPQFVDDTVAFIALCIGDDVDEVRHTANSAESTAQTA